MLKNVLPSIGIAMAAKIGFGPFVQYHMIKGGE